MFSLGLFWSIVWDWNVITKQKVMICLKAKESLEACPWDWFALLQCFEEVVEVPSPSI